jgi:hypothetical protein
MAVLRAQSELRHLNVARAFCSIGSMIHFKFGDLSQSNDGRHSYERGEYDLMIELADWEIQRHERLIATCWSDRRTIDRTMRLLLGTRVQFASFSMAHSSIRFSNGFQLSLRPNRHYYGDWNGMSNWVLFREDDVEFGSEFGELSLNNRECVS